jgi:hypothetical protein
MWGRDFDVGKGGGRWLSAEFLGWGLGDGVRWRDCVGRL